MDNSEEILARLKFIGHIQKEEKINVHQVSRQPNTILTKFLRSFVYPDNRVNCIKFIRDVITRSFEIIELNKNTPLVCKGIIVDLIRAKQGILNIKYTYTDDTKFCCDMDIIIESISSNMDKLKKQYPGLFESN